MTHPNMNTQKMYQELCRGCYPGYPSYDEFSEKVNKLVEGDPYPHLRKGRAIWEVMKEYGYNKTTVRNDYVRMVAQHVDALDALRVTADAQSVMDALNSIPDLPSSVDPAVEVAWVRCHPAMLRKQLQKDSTQQVRITVDDILAAPHGLPPSRGAVSWLVGWVNRPEKFQEMMLTEHRKAKYVGEEGQEEAEASNDVSLHEVRELLKGLSAR